MKKNLVFILLKKQLYEINRSLFVDQKTNKRRSTVAIIFFVALMAVIPLFFAALFLFLALMTCEPFAAAGLGWFYFTVMSGAAILLGVFGSVFNTYASVYLAKDNDLLLSLPIPVKDVLIARLLGVLSMSFYYSAPATITSAVVYMVLGLPSALGVIGSLLLVPLVTLIVFMLSCGLGYIVAKLSQKLKNKGFLSALITLAFIGVYYLFYFKANELIGQIVANGEAVASGVKAFAYPLYAMGKVGEGSPIAIVCFTAAVLILLGLVWLLLSKSFLKIVISGGKTKKVVFNGKISKQCSPEKAFFKKELRRYLSSANYMLNTSIGSIFMLLVSVAILIYAPTIREIIALSADGDGTNLPRIMSVMALGIAMLLSANNFISAPSISLEGKTLWIIKSLPIRPKTAFSAKSALHFVITAPFTLFASIVLSVVLRLSPLSAIICVLAALAFVLLCGRSGVIINLAFPNVKWTNETIAVKQGLSVLFSMLGGIIYTIILCVPYIFIAKFVLPEIYLAIILAINVLLTILSGRYLSTKAAAVLNKL
ncbi:MAG: hypothetical protein PUH93_02520 [Clostridia bacterium]|nr:hypothetical protein [Clostridia bacterium]